MEDGYGHFFSILESGRIEQSFLKSPVKKSFRIFLIPYPPYPAEERIRKHRRTRSLLQDDFDRFSLLFSGLFS